MMGLRAVAEAAAPAVLQLLLLVGMIVVPTVEEEVEETAGGKSLTEGKKEAGPESTDGGSIGVCYYCTKRTANTEIREVPRAVIGLVIWEMG